MTFAAVPLGFQPPLTVAVCSIKLRLDQSQQSHGQQWHLIGSQNRFLCPGPALFHAETLFVIAVVDSSAYLFSPEFGCSCTSPELLASSVTTNLELLCFSIFPHLPVVDK